MKKILVFISLLVLVSILTLWFYPTNKQPDLSQYSDPDYAKFVELQAYLMTTEQVANLFATNLNEIPDHLTFQNIYNKWDTYAHKLDQLYLVIRIKNEGDRCLSGVLNCVPSLGGISEFQILWLNPYQENYQNLIRPVLFGGIQLEKINTENPQLTWKHIYTKPIQ